MIALVLFVAAAASTAVVAPIQSVTVFSDRARVVRAATLDLDGPRAVELPLLPDSVDVDSIRLEATGATVRLVNVTRGEEGEFPGGEAKELLEKLERLDDRLVAALTERANVSSALGVLRRLRPQVPEGDPLKPLPKLSPGGWALALAFVEGGADKLQQRQRDLDQRLIDLGDERRKLAERAEQLGGARRERGVRVKAVVAGQGTASLQLVYFVSGARWMPTYDLQYLPGEEKVEVRFGAQVSQTSGEEWRDARITVSTAVPGVTARLPKLLTWKIGEKERFLPVSRAARPPQPPTGAPWVAQPRTEEQRRQERAQALRSALLERARRPPEPPADAAPAEDAAEEQDERSGAVGGAGRGAGAVAKSERKEAMLERERSEEQRVAPRQYMAATMAPPPPPAAAPAPMPPQRAMAKLARPVAEAVSRDNADRSAGPSPLAVGLAPPPSYVPPTFAPDAPATLAGGVDLAFTAPRPATIASGGGARAVPLFAETWPVATERVLWPAVAKEAYLVAEIKNPSARTLPGGHADLFVGQDPSGTARLSLVAPGESFTLPLGLDRALKPVRNVTQVQTEKGVFSKDEVTQYTVTIEVANPYPHALPLKVVDQVPLAADANTEITLARSDPPAALDKDKGELTWRLQLPASGKQVLTFVYELKRPKGYRVHQ